MELKGISVAVTGGASGLGNATARRLVDAGAFVTLVDLPGHPEREVFTSTRLAAAARPAVVACRDALARAARATATPSAR